MIEFVIRGIVWSGILALAYYPIVLCIRALMRRMTLRKQRRMAAQAEYWAQRERDAQQACDAFNARIRAEVERWAKLTPAEREEEDRLRDLAQAQEQQLYASPNPAPAKPTNDWPDIVPSPAPGIPKYEEPYKPAPYVPSYQAPPPPSPPPNPHYK